VKYEDEPGDEFAGLVALQNPPMRHGRTQRTLSQYQAEPGRVHLVPPSQNPGGVKQLTKSLLFKLFSAGDRLGLQILPKHFYSPVPDSRWLNDNKPLWMPRADLGAIPGWNLNAQITWLEGACEAYREVGASSFTGLSANSAIGPGYGPVESQVLHCFIRRFCPKRVIEIGSGVTTAIMLEASRQNVKEGRPATKITCIDPRPSRAINSHNDLNVVKLPCQAVPLEIFDQLEAGDLLFVDSTHSVKTGSDVIRIYLQIIPQLTAGVFIHAHDVFFPYLYPRDAMAWLWNWQETALLLALLSGNKRLSVLACLSALHYDKSRDLQTILTDYLPQPGDLGLALQPPGPGHFPSSIWMQTI